jgi:rubredoxin
VGIQVRIGYIMGIRQVTRLPIRPRGEGLRNPQMQEAYSGQLGGHLGVSVFEDVMDKRTCRTCGEPKPLEEMTKNKKGLHGRAKVCKMCTATYMRNWTKTRDLYENKRRWRMGNRESVRESSRRWREKNIDKALVQQVLNAAVKKGTVIRPKKCSGCNGTCKPQGHHDDYSNPLDVRWLCPRCHRAHHNEVSNG